MSDVFEEKIRAVDWAQYSGPTAYNPHTVASTLRRLLKYDGGDSQVGSDILFSIGNNHAGTYYPAILAALEIIIEFEKSLPPTDPRKMCAYAILNNLAYFHPEVGEYQGCTNEELGEFAQALLAEYRDDG